MGWGSGAEIYEKAAEVFTKTHQVPGISLEDAFFEFADTLQNHDWDTEDDALSSLDPKEQRAAWRALMRAIDRNPDCPGRCHEISCETDVCGCPCHA